MIRLALDRPVSTIVAILATVVLGIFAFAQIPVALLPEMQRPFVVVDVSDERQSRDELATGLTEPLERTLASIDGVASIRSETRDGHVIVRVEPEWQADADRLLVEVARRASSMDGDGRQIAVTVAPPDASPVIELVVTGGEPSGRADLARSLLRPELARLHGAGRIDLLGLTVRRAVIRPRLSSLMARGATIEDVVGTLRLVGEPLSAGSARDGVSERPLIVVQGVASAEALRALLVRTPRGSMPLGDLADVSVEDEGGDSIVRHAGEDAVLVRAWRAPGANAMALARDVRGLASSLRPGSGLHVRVASDRSGEIADALRELLVAAVTGVALGTLVLRYLLGRWGPTLALLAVTLASILAAFAAFRFAGVPLDIVSLSGLALAAGMLVDNAVVVAEAIEASRARGEPRPALDGTRRIAVAVAASCVTTVVVFVPFLYLRGLARAFFGEQAFAVVATLLISLVFALTLTPVLAERFGRSESGPGRPSGRHPGRALVVRCLDAALGRPAAAALLGLALAGLTVVGLVLLPRQLFGDGASREVLADLELPPGLSPAEARRRVIKAEAAATQALGQVAPGSVVTVVQGLPEGAAFEGDVRRETGVLRAELPDSALAQRALPELDAALSRVAGVRARVRLRPGAFVEALSSAGGAEVVVTAADDAAAARLASAAADAVRRETECVARPPRSRLASPAVTVTWDPLRLAALNASADALDAQVEAALRPRDAGRLEIPGVEAVPRLEIPDGTWQDMPIRVPVPRSAADARATQVVPLRALAGITVVAREPVLEREGLQACRRLVIDAGAGRDVRDFERAAASVPVAAGERVRLGGEALELRQAFGQLRFALVLSLVLCFLTVAVAYESLVLPILVMTTVPVASGGGLALLLAAGHPFGLMAFIGLIVLGGIAVDNAIVLLDRVETLRAEGTPERQALLEAAGERWRPILMTTMTTLLGALPLALIGGEGAELRRPLALVLIGGLVTSTLASLIVVPVLHSVLEARGLVRRGRKSD